MSFVFTILGCGSSGGVPRIGQGWGACDPTNPKNRRRRCSLFVERIGPDGARTQVLVDTSPDLRAQLLDLEVTRLDAILLTHSHADHTHGIDDVRPLTIMARRRIDLHMDAETSAVVRHAFDYIFQSPPGSNYPALLNERRLTPGTACRVDGPGGPVEALPFRLHHGEIDALGFRFGDVAYTPDLNAIPDASVGFLENLDLWIIDALRYARHPSHLSVEEALGWIDRMKPRRAILTNLHTDLDFETLARTLPAHVQPAHDGMRIEVP
jgi:phosphoribosyl 1,2-cyclic phosphate phosphodiesterase